MSPSKETEFEDMVQDLVNRVVDVSKHHMDAAVTRREASERPARPSAGGGGRSIRTGHDRVLGKNLLLRTKVTALLAGGAVTREGRAIIRRLGRGTMALRHSTFRNCF